MPNIRLRDVGHDEDKLVSGAGTHPDDVPTRRLLARLGFECRGTINVWEDDTARLAFGHV